MAEEKREDLEKKLREMERKENRAIAGGGIVIGSGMAAGAYVSGCFMGRGYSLPVALGAGVACVLVSVIASEAVCRHYGAKVSQLRGQMDKLYRWIGEE